MNEFGDNEVEFTKGSSYIMSNKSNNEVYKDTNPFLLLKKFQKPKLMLKPK